MELEHARELALELMKQHGLEYRFRFEFDNAKRRFGYCCFNPRIISLSKNLVQLNDRNIVKNVILHEIAHALVGPRNGHNWVWRQTAIEIGCDGNRCYDSNKVNPVIGKLVAECPHCNHIYYKHRKPKGKRACGKCRHLPFEERILNFKSNISIESSSKTKTANGIKQKSTTLLKVQLR